MRIPSQPVDALRPRETRDELIAAMADVVQSCDPDRLARHLGLAHASQATALIQHPAALSRLAERLGDGCTQTSIDEAVTMARALLGRED